MQGIIVVNSGTGNLRIIPTNRQGECDEPIEFDKGGSLERLTNPLDNDPRTAENHT